jgi:hypothetical protein
MNEKTIIYCPYGLNMPVWVAFCNVRFGKKYIYVKFLDSKLQEEFKLEKDKVLIFEGIREDIKQKYEEWQRNKEKWHEERKKFIYELEYELRKNLSEKLEEWDKNNPYPMFRVD